MPVQTHLMNRNGIYYCRVPIPKSLQNPAGKKEVWKSLGVRSYSEAIQAAKVEVSLILEELSDMKPRLEYSEDLRIEGQKQLTKDVIQAIHDLHYNLILKQDEARRDMIGGRIKELRENGNEEQIEQVKISALKSLQYSYESALEQVNYGDYDKITKKALGVVKQHNVSLDLQNRRDKAAFHKLCRAMLDARVSAYKVCLDRYEGDWGKGRSKVRYEELAALRRGAKRANAATFAELIELYNNASENREKSQRLKDKVRTYQRVLCELVGVETSIEQIDRQLARRVCDQIRLMPQNAYKKFADKTMPQIISATKEDNSIKRLSPSSINDYIEHFGQLLSWAKREGYDVDNYVSDLRVKEDKRNKTRLPFTLEQLNLIFSEKGVLQYKNKPQKQHDYWVPVIFLITGSRPGEIIHYRVSDIREKQGIAYISVNVDGEEKSVKTKESLRDMVIHNKLIALGFLDYVSQIEKRYGKDSALFPDNVIGKTSPIDPLSKRFNGKLRNLGIEDSKYVFYSLRHNYRDFERDYGAGAPATANAGWSTSKEVHDTYGKGYNLAVKRDAINKIKFDGIEFLKPENLS